MQRGEVFMSKSIGAVILAAGRGERLKILETKPLAPVMDRCLIDYPIRAVQDFFKRFSVVGNLTLVVGFQKEKLQRYIRSQYSADEERDRLHFVEQKEQKGTAHALQAYFTDLHITFQHEYTMVLCADTPLIEAEDLWALYSEIEERSSDGGLVSCLQQDPTGFGRIIRRGGGDHFKIVEEKDASVDEKKILEVNSGLCIFRTEYLLKNLYKINDHNESGEFYLTDLFREDRSVFALKLRRTDHFLGINSLEQLEYVEKLLRLKHMKKLRNAGVRFIDLKHSYVDDTVEILPGTVIFPHAFIQGNTRIGKDVLIEPGVCIKDSILDEGVHVKAYSHLESCHVESMAVIGPFARVRPNTRIGAHAKIGNFVEIKNSQIASKVKISHLSYLGDASVGENSNIGCGFITCNFNGREKDKTEIGKDCFIGSHSQTVAPIKIEDRCFVASGTTLTHNMQAGDFAISRGKQITKPSLAKKFLKLKNSEV